MAQVLIVDDNPADQTLIAEAFRESFKKDGNQSTLQLFGDGDSVLEYLRKNTANKISKTGLVVLDLNLPGKHGFEVLDEIKENPQTKNIPVVIFTTSDSRDDVDRAYSRFANSYVIKPMSLEKLFDVVDSMKRYWFETVELSKVPV